MLTFIMSERNTRSQRRQYGSHDKINEGKTSNLFDNGFHDLARLRSVDIDREIGLTSKQGRQVEQGQ